MARRTLSLRRQLAQRRRLLRHGRRRIPRRRVIETAAQLGRPAPLLPRHQPQKPRGRRPCLLQRLVKRQGKPRRHIYRRQQDDPRLVVTRRHRQRSRRKILHPTLSRVRTRRRHNIRRYRQLARQEKETEKNKTENASGRRKNRHTRRRW